MGRQPAISPVVIDLVDSDSDIEIIHHTIVVSDDEAPPEQGPSRPTTRQVCPLRMINEETGSDNCKERSTLALTPAWCQGGRCSSSDR